MQKEINDDTIPLESSSPPRTLSSEEVTSSSASNIRDLILQEKIEKLLVGLFSLAIHKKPEDIDVDRPTESYHADADTLKRFKENVEKIVGALPSNLLEENKNLRALGEYIYTHHTAKVEKLFGTKSKGGPASTPKPFSSPEENSVETISEKETTEAKNAPPAAESEANNAPATSQNEKENSTPPLTEAPVLTETQAHHFNLEKRTHTQDIAVIGIGGKFAQANNIRSLWDNLKQKKKCIHPMPLERQEAQKQLSPNGSNHAPKGGFLKNLEAFDSTFFGMTEEGAESFTLSEKLFLKTVSAAMEDAGYGTEEGLGSDVGVYLCTHPQLYSQIEQNESTANPSLSLAHRISGFFALEGPSIEIDVNNASSLTPLHLACQALRCQEAEAAIVGGLHLYSASNGATESNSEMTTPGEGAGAVILKRLDDALCDNDNVHAVIKATALNHQSPFSSKTDQNESASIRLLQNIFKRGDIQPSSVGFVESSGSNPNAATQALEKAFTNIENKRTIGSTQTNLGNLHSAAGMASLLKTIAQLKKKQVLPFLGDDSDSGDSVFEKPSKLSSWERQNTNSDHSHPLHLRAGIHAAELNGTNAHIIVEEAPAYPEIEAKASEEVVITLSATNKDSLTQITHQFLTFAKDAFESGEAFINDLSSIAFTLQAGRRHLDERLAFTISSPEEWVSKFNQFSATKKLQDIGVTGNIHCKDSTTHTLLEGAPGQAFLEALLKERNLNKLSILWTMGIEVDWLNMLAGNNLRRVSLPTYPFEPEVSWDTPFNPSDAPFQRAATQQENEFVKRELTNTLSEMLWVGEEELKSDVALSQYGIDRDLTHKFANKINNRFGVRIHKNQFTQEATIEELTQALIDSLFEENVPSASQ